MSGAPVFADPSTLLRRLDELGVQPGGAVCDSRMLRPGDLFVAISDTPTDGRRYIPEALARGASAVLWQPGGDFAWSDSWAVPSLPVDNVRAVAGPLAHALCGHPSERLALLAITGTNGKTSISQWLARAHPRRCAAIGTLGAGFAEAMAATGFTTPEGPTLARYLADFADAGAAACALEASSIGVEERRLDGARIDTAIFTNLTRDHLDYHGSMDSYAAAKEKLFVWPRLRLAIINLDDPFGRQLSRRTTAVRVIGYTQEGIPGDGLATVRAEGVEEGPSGLRFRLVAPNGRAEVATQLFGRYNVANLLAVAAVLVDAGLSPVEVAGRLSALQPPPGRLESVGGEQRPLVVVDYAHTPDALQNALAALRTVAAARRGRLTVVFGCGGDRDRGKRPLMGAIAARLADRVVLTSDNPRSENPQSIVDEIRAAAPAAEVLVDRGAAIRGAIDAAAAEDVVLLAGKGHEAYQEIAGVRRPFSDLAEARAALATRQGEQQ